MSNAASLGILGRVDPGSGYGQQWNYTASATLTSAQDGGLVTNLGAVAAITLTLPAAVAGREIQVLRVANYAITMTPAGTDGIREGAPGKSFTINNRGLTVFACSVSGTWEIVLGGSQAELFLSDFGATGDGVTDDAAAISAAIVALNAAGGGKLTGSPNRTYRVNSSLQAFTQPFQLQGGGYSTQFKSYVTGDAAVFTVADGVQFWSMDGFTITSPYAYDTFLTGATDGQACKGLVVGAGASTTNRFAISNVFMRGLKVGAELDGFIVSAHNWFFRECETGLIINNTAAAGAYDLGVKFENCRKSFSISNANALYMRQLLDEGVLSAGEHIASTIDNCDSVTLVAPYWEAAVSRAVPYLTVGGTSQCLDVNIKAGSFGGATDLTVVPVVFDRVVGGSVSFSGSNGATHALFDTTANTGDVLVSYPKKQGEWPLDTSKTYGPMFNHFPNSDFSCWVSGSAAPRGWYDLYLDNVTLTRETTLVRRGPCAMKIQASTSAGTSHYVQFTLSGNGSTTASKTTAALSGKRVKIGAWIWVPDLPEFASTSPSGTEAGKVNLYAISTDAASTTTNSDTAAGGTFNHHAVPGRWNFIWTLIDVIAACTRIDVLVYLNRGGTLPDTDAYIVLDSVQIVEDRVPFDYFLHGLVTAAAPTIDAVCEGGSVRMFTDVAGGSTDASQYFGVGDVLQRVTPTSGASWRTVCVTAGAGGTAANWKGEAALA